MTIVVIVGTVADVQPAGSQSAVLQKALVEVQMVHYPEVPAAAGVEVRKLHVGGTTVLVQRVAYIARPLKEQFAEVSVADLYGVAYVVAQRLQHFAAQLAQVYHHLPLLRRVVNTQTAGRLVVCQLAQQEVLRELRIWIKCLHNFAFIGLNISSSGLTDDAKV